MASQADADDVSIFFYSGHGGHVYDTSGDEKDGLDETICPDLVDILDDELTEWMDSIKGKKVVIIDSCHSGGFVKGEGIRTLPGLPYAEITDGFVRDLNKAGYVTLTACEDDKSAWSDRKLKNGVFTYYVVKGLGGPANDDADRDISAEETYNYAKQLVVDHAAGIGKEQHPQIHNGLNPGEQPVVKWS